MGGEGMSRKFFPPARWRRRRTVVVASLPVVIAAVVVAVAGGSGAGTTGKESTHAYRDRPREQRGPGRRSGLAATASATAGPQVINGHFQGTSPAVSSLPVLPVPHGPAPRPRDRVAQAAASAPPGAKDPVVQGKKGSGPISGPIQNFDGICLPFGAPCALPSSCSCLPPDTNGEVGATQYVQMVNTDFAVFSKTTVRC